MLRFRRARRRAGPSAGPSTTAAEQVGRPSLTTTDAEPIGRPSTAAAAPIGRPSLTPAEQVDWSSLRHAYGPATDVPGLLGALFDPDADVRTEATDDLWSRLCHQETVYPASAAAVPVLLRVARDSRATPAVRLQLLALIVFIGRGEDGTWAGYTELETVQDAQRAVAAVVPAIVAWSEETSDAAVSAAVVALAASFAPALHHVRRVLPEDADPRLLAARDLAIRLADGPPVAVEDCVTAADCDPDVADLVAHREDDAAAASLARTVVLELALAATGRRD